MGPRAGPDGCEKSRPPPGLDPRAFQPVSSRYTDYAYVYVYIYIYMCVFYTVLYVLLIASRRLNLILTMTAPPPPSNLQETILRTL